MLGMSAWLSTAETVEPCVIKLVAPSIPTEPGLDDSFSISLSFIPEYNNYFQQYQTKVQTTLSLFLSLCEHSLSEQGAAPNHDIHKTQLSLRSLT